MYKKNETVVYLILAVLVLFISESSSDLIVNSRLDAYFYPNFYYFLINAIIGIALSIFALNFAKKNLKPIDLLGSINKYSFYSLLTMIALLSIILLVRWLDLDNIYLGGQIYAGGKPLFIQIVLLYLPVYRDPIISRDCIQRPVGECLYQGRKKNCLYCSIYYIYSLYF